MNLILITHSGIIQLHGLELLLTSSSASIDLDECIERLYRKELIAEPVIEAICAKTKELLMKESNVVHIKAPVTVVGDIHGQFFDLLEIFRIGGFCPDTNYLFLGQSLHHSREESSGSDSGDMPCLPWEWCC